MGGVGAYATKEGDADAGRPGTEGALIRAAGAVVWRRPEGRSAEPEVVLVHRPRYDDWSLPKGKLHRGEHPLPAALREVREETGLEVRAGRPLPTAHYEVGGRPKEVRYWSAEIAREVGFEPGDEVDAIEWLPLRRARERLTHPWDGRIVGALTDAPLRTAALVVLRHAHAEPRAGWPGPVDAGRPLNAEGMAQAEALVDLLGCFGRLGVVTSDATRCLQTVLPYARAYGENVRPVGALSEEGFAADPSAASRLAASLVAVGSPVVLCTHRSVLPDVISGALNSSAPAAPEAPTTPEAPTHPLAKAEALLLHVAAGRVVALDRMAPLTPPA